MRSDKRGSLPVAMQHLLKPGARRVERGRRPW
jgi:hypothetical protein